MGTSYPMNYNLPRINQVLISPSALLTLFKGAPPLTAAVVVALPIPITPVEPPFLRDAATIVAVGVAALMETDPYVNSVEKLGILPLPVITGLIILIPVTPGPLCKPFWPLHSLNVIQTGTQIQVQLIT